MDLNLASLLQAAALRLPEKTIAVAGDQRITYTEMERWAARIAAALERENIGKGDVVALCCPNSLEFIACFYGILRTGAAVLPINFLIKRDGIATQLSHAGAVGFFCHGGSEENPIGAEGWAAYNDADACKHFWRLGGGWSEGHAAAEAPSLEDWLTDVPAQAEIRIVTASDPAIIAYTSGTTGAPKGVCTNHGAEYTTSLATVAAYGYTERDTGLVVLPLFTSMGQALLLNPLVAVGATMVLQPRFHPEQSLELIERHRVTVTVAVPTVHKRLVTHGANGAHDYAAHWRVAIYGGSSMDAEVRDQFEASFKVPVQQAYGMTETRVSGIGPRFPEKPEDHSGLAPAPGFAYRVVDMEMNPVPDGEKGQLIVRGPGVMDGYLASPQANASAYHDAWFCTGDVVERRQDGLYYIVGRMKDMISRGGYKVYPSEVEAALCEHPQVAEAAVFGVADPEYGEEVAAVVVSGDDSTELDIPALQDWLRQRLPAYMYPRLIGRVPALPMTPTGKVKKDALPAMLADSTPGMGAR